MKIGLLGDLHLNSMCPGRRLDENYLDTQMLKLDQAYEIFKDAGCDIVLQPGDYFDSCTVANRTKSAAIAQIKRSGFWGRIYVVWGQHDVSSHSAATVPNSPLTVLASGGAVHVLGPEPIIVEPEPEGGPGGSPAHGRPVALYGAPFGQPVPEPVQKLENFCNIMAGHIMVGNRPLWPGQDLPSPKRFLREHPDYGLIFLGDYHYRFSATLGDRRIANMGALMRKTIGEYDQALKPACGVYDTETNELETIELKVSPAKDTFNFEKEVKSSDNAILAELVEKLSDENLVLCDWRRILQTVLEELNAGKGPRDIIDDTLEEIKKNGK